MCAPELLCKQGDDGEKGAKEPLKGNNIHPSSSPYALQFKPFWGTLVEPLSLEISYPRVQYHLS